MAFDVLVYVSGTGAVQGNFSAMGTRKPISCSIWKTVMRTAGRPGKVRRGKCVSGWFIEAPEKFDTPSPLAEFGLDRPPMSWQYVEIPDEMEAEHE